MVIRVVGFCSLALDDASGAPVRSTRRGNRILSIIPFGLYGEEPLAISEYSTILRM
jgi:hypothetical protein